MFQTLYIEEEIVHHPRVKKLCQKYSHLPQVTCQRYGEIFNPQAQNFRLQKQAPSLILAKKCGQFILPTPKGYGIGAEHNFYFSHMFNCLFDCRYCFLQGMYPSANYVLFINFEDFIEAIKTKVDALNHQASTFFSGYDCDSLAMDPITEFVPTILPAFEKLPHALLELRTKSIQIRSLLKKEPLTNCVIAFTLTPKEIAKSLEHKAPPLEKRLEALTTLAKLGWKIGLRFDPIIYCSNFETIYAHFFDTIAQSVKEEWVHSISLGAFRLPKHIYKKMEALYPDEKLFAWQLEEHQGLVSYKAEVEKDCLNFCKNHILKIFSPTKFFPCT